VETARFQIVGGVRIAGLLHPPWPVVESAPAVVDSAPAVEDATEPWFGWRLLSRNHRDLARSPSVYSSVAACLATIDTARHEAAGADSALTKNTSTGRWSWQLTTLDVPVAIGSRGYLRRRECYDCIVQVIELVTVARTPEPGAVTSARGGRRARPGRPPSAQPRTAARGR
jgi:uncharacterized protein YegP (UPF0339 family)